MDFTVRERPGRISCLWERNTPVPTRISQCLVTDKTFPNPLIYQMANPVNSLRNIITCNLFCYSFGARASLPWQLPRSQAGAAASALQFPLQWEPGAPRGSPPCWELQGSGEGGRQQRVQLPRHRCLGSADSSGWWEHHEAGSALRVKEIPARFHGIVGWFGRDIKD